MTIHPSIEDYFDAEKRGDVDAIVALFAPDAQVVDENTTWRGQDGIRAWREHATAEYTWTTEILDVEADGNTTIVKVRIEGDFPGGTADLRQRFRLEDDRIGRLEIAP